MKNILIILFCVPIFIFGQNNIKYIENNGQWGDQFLYQADISSGKVYLEEKSITYNFFDVEQLNSSHLSKSSKSLGYLDLFSYKVNFLNSNQYSSVISSNKRTEYYNYFIGSNKDKWKNNVSAYNSIFYSSIYKGIDCKFYSEANFLKYDFIISPGYDPNQIQLLYSGVELLIEDNTVIIDLGFNNIFESKPIAYQIIDNKKLYVKCNYVLSNNIISFEFPNGYNNNYELIIDPVLITSTLSGSQASTTWGHSATYDAEGNIYTGARCFSSGYPTTSGAYQINYSGGTNDIAISKLDSTGSTLTWATYLGGSGDDFPHSLIVNSQNELCIYGSSTSSNYPTSTNAYDNSSNGSSDIIITHLDSTGANLIGSSYFGGSSDDGLNYIVNNYGDEFRGEIMVDDFDNIFIASFSSSSDFPTTSGVYQQTIGGDQDAIILKVNSDLSSLIWSTFIGGSGYDAGYGIRVDNNYIYLTGSASSGFPVVSGSAITSFIGGSYDGFVAKFNHQATSLLASTYFGTSSTDQSFFIDLDRDSAIYIYGQNGTALSISSGCYGVANSSQFIAKLDNNLSNIEWQTTIGSGSSSTDFVPIAFLVDVCNNIYISGHGGLNTIPSMFTTSDALYTSGSFYLMQLSPNANSVDYATHYTGNHVDGGTSRFDPSGIVYQAVCSCPFGGPASTMATTSNAFSTVHYGDCDIGVFKLDFETSPALAIASANPASGTAPLTIAFNNMGNGNAFFWDFDDNGQTSTLRDPIHTYTNAGTYYVQLIAIDSSSCNIADTLILTVIVTSPPCFISLLDSSNISCFGAYDGYLSVQGIGSGGYYAYSLQIFNSTLNAWIELAHSPSIGSFSSLPITFGSLALDCYKIVMSDSTGCSDTLDICLSEPNQIFSNLNIIACDSYDWDGNTLDTSGIYFDTLVSVNSCDSIVILNLTINTLSSILVDTACGQYFYNGIFYDSSGVFTDTLVSTYGCDSVVILSLTVFQDSSVTYITACDSAEFNGVWYYNSDTVVVTGLSTVNIFGGYVSPSSGNESNFWYFGGGGAGIDFNSGVPIPLSDGQITTGEGCSSISDNNGDLLFYTDGQSVYNKNHTLMPNGSFLTGHSSSSQSAVIVKKPASASIYYIFTVDGMSGSNGNGLYYSEVDMDLDGGLGDITTNKNVMLFSGGDEKVTAIKHANDVDFWIIGRVMNTNMYNAYLLSNLGVNTTAISTNIGQNYGGGTIGYLKGSPSGDKLIACNYLGSPKINLFDFDNNTGMLSNNQNFTNEPSQPAYGIEFSPSGDLLYISTVDGNPAQIYQYDLSLSTFSDINNSGTEIGTVAGTGGALQLAPDGRIYMANGYPTVSNLSYISNPDSIGLSCNFNPNGFSLDPSTYAIFGLPTFYSSILSIPPLGCDSVATAIININISSSDTTDVIATDNYLWPINGLNYNNSGIYTSISLNSSGCTFTQLLNLTINISGCTDSLALNYNNLAIIDDGSCIYPCNITLLDSLNISCYGADDGLIELLGSGTTNTFSYQLQAYDSLYMSWLSIGQSPLSGLYTQYPVVFSNLYSGCYRVIMTDSLSCSDTINICLTEPNILSLIDTIVNATLPLNNDGSITLSNISGGYLPYSYLWNGPNSFLSTNQNIANLESGFYSLVLTDDTLCSQTFLYYVNLLTPGCTDPTANNFNPAATVEDSTCCYLNFYNDNIILCLGDSVELVYSGSTVNIDSYLWSTGDTSSSLIVSPNINSTYWLEQTNNNVTCSDSVSVSITCLSYSPDVTISLSNYSCDSLTDLTIVVSQDPDEIDMDTSLFSSDLGSFKISVMNIGDIVGSASMIIGSLTTNANLLVSSIVSSSKVILEAINLNTGLVLGTFTLENLIGGGVEILAVSVGDGNSYTLNGNSSTVTFNNIFENSNTGFINFTTNIVSELGDIDIQYLPQILNCITYSPTVSVFMSNTNCDSIADITIIVSQDPYELDMDTAFFSSNAGYFLISNLNLGDTIGLATLTISTSTFNTDLIINTIVSSSEIIVDAIDKITGVSLGSFIIKNLFGGGVEIIAISPDDGNIYTNGNNSILYFNGVFVNPNSSILEFTSQIISETGIVDTQSFFFNIYCVTFSPLVSVSLSNLNCGLTDLTINVVQDINEVDMDTAIFISDGGSFTIYLMNIGDNIGLANMILSSNIFNADLIINNIISSSEIIVEAVDQITGVFLGTFMLENLIGGGVKIIAISPDDGNNYTSGNSSIVTFNNIFDSPNTVSVNFSSNIISELGDIDLQTFQIALYCATFDPIVSVSLSNLNCSLTDLTISVIQDTNQVDMDTAIFVSDGGFFTISTMNTGDNIGFAIMTLYLNTFTADLIVNNIISSSEVIVEAVDQLTGTVLGTFSIINLLGGGVEIIVISPDDGNNYTSGNSSVITFTNVFDSPNTGFLNFSSNISSELGEIALQNFPFILNCTSFSPTVTVSLLDFNCGVITDLTISVAQDSNEVDMDTAIFVSSSGSFTISSMSLGDNIGSATMILSNNTYNTSLIVSNIVSLSEIIVEAIDQFTGLALGTFSITNLPVSGVEIIAVSPGDGNFFTNGNSSIITFNNVFLNSSSGLITFNSNITSELDDIYIQSSSFIIGSLYSSFSIVSCDQYIWNSTTYDSTGVYIDTLTSIIGCDSIVTLDLIVSYSSSSFDSVFVCNNYFWNNNLYDTTGVYIDTILNNANCDSIMYLYLNVNSNNFISYTIDSVTACDSLLWNGNSYDSSGTYIDTLLSIYGCDSIVTLTITINNSNSSSSIITSCDSLLWNGINYTASGLYDTILTNIAGCDSFTQLYLTIIPTVYNNLNIHSCGSHIWNGVVYDTSGIYSDTLLSVGYCDSIVIVNLIVTDLITVDVASFNVNCFGDSTGQINMNTVSGSSPFSYQWSNGLISEDIFNLYGDSIYSCIIIDSAGCSFDTSIYISQPSLLTVNPIISNVSCFGGNDGSISLNINGGVIPYDISWGTTDTVNLISGFYNYIVTDSNGCVVSNNIEITEEDPFVIDISLLNIQCFGQATGLIELSVLTGSGVFPYTYNWIGPNLFSSNLNIIYNLFAGDYFLTITDANLCEFDTMISLLQPINLSQNTSIQTSNYSGFNIGCKGDNSGWVSVVVTGGYEPYSYLWSNLQTSDSIYNLSAGLYTLEVTDSLGCVIIFDFPLIEPIDIISSSILATTNYNGYNISCYSLSDGALEGVATGGVPDYTYFWNSVLLTNSIVGLSVGEYELTVYDKNNCVSVSNITLTEPDSLFLNINSFTDTCFRGVGSSQVSVFGGVSPYDYSWSTGSSIPLINNFFEGNYQIVVNDANLCQVSDSVIINNLPSPIIDFTINPSINRLFEQLEDSIVFIDVTEGIWQDIVSWNWDYNDGNFGTDSISYHAYSDTGSYIVMLTTISEYNCIDTLTKIVLVNDYNLYIPNAFTPFSTDDNLNDIFKAYGTGITEFKMDIFSRWGEIIFTSNSLDIGWDGTSKNDNQVPVGIYIYLIEAENIYGETFKYNGQVKLIR